MSFPSRTPQRPDLRNGLHPEHSQARCTTPDQARQRRLSTRPAYPKWGSHLFARKGEPRLCKIAATSTFTGNCSVTGSESGSTVSVVGQNGSGNQPIGGRLRGHWSRWTTLRRAADGPGSAELPASSHGGRVRGKWRNRRGSCQPPAGNGSAGRKYSRLMC